MKKNLFYSFITILIVVWQCQISNLSAQTFSGGGNGTSSNPWKLTNEADIDTLATWLASSWDGWSEYKVFELLNDIGSPSSPITTMIGTSTRSFRGELRGNGNSIHINYVGTAKEMALFKYASMSCKITNLTLEGNVTYTGANADDVYIAGLIACVVDAFCGSAQKLYLSGCTNRANITGTNRVGGLIAQINGPVECYITNCANKGNVSLFGKVHYGGIVGTIALSSNKTVDISGCSSDSGSVIFTPTGTSDTIHIGGIAGCINFSNTTITNSYNSSSINSSGSIMSPKIIIGGITALNSASNFTITYSQNYALITVTGNDIVIGGIIGENFPVCTLNVSNCNNFETISATSGTANDIRVGGILGNNSGRTTIKHCNNRGMTNTSGSLIKAAGIVGDNDTAKGVSYSPQLFIDTCYNYANHISECSGYLTHVGGILGDNFGTFTITGCRNSGDILGYGKSKHYDLGGIVGDNMATGTITRCTNIGTIYTTQDTSSSMITVGGIIGFGNMSITINNCHNAGLVQGVGNVGGIIGSKYYGGTISNNLNNGCVVSNNSSNSTISGIAGSSNGGTITNNYYDRQMCIYGGVNNGDVAGAKGYFTNELIGSGISLSMYWTYNANLYPMLSNDSISRVAASPAFLHYSSFSTFDKHNSVKNNFNVSTLNSINWTSSNTGVVSISGTSATLNGIGSCNIYPNLGSFRRTVPITTGTPSYLLVTRPDTVGHGTTTPDSVKILGNVTITATPSPCYEFVAWIDKNKDTISKNQTHIIVFNRDTLLIAVFKNIGNRTLRLGKNPTEGGTISGGKTNVPCGTLDTVSAIPNPCYEFISWTDSVTGKVFSTESEFIIAIDSNRTLIANFQKIDGLVVKIRTQPQYKGTINIQFPGSNTITSDTYLNVLTTCEKSKIIIWAEPIDCYQFRYWLDSATGTIFSTKIKDTITAFIDFNTHLSLISVFEKDLITITTTPAPKNAGTTSVNGGQAIAKVGCGDDFIISAKPTNASYKFVNWTNTNTKEVVSNKIIDTLNLTEDISLTANFLLNALLVKLRSNIDDAGTLTGEGLYSDGSMVTISATSNPNYQFKHWQTEDGKVLSTTPTYTFKLTSDTNLVAYFYIIEYAVTMYALESYMGKIEGGTTGLYPKGYTFNLQATSTEPEFYAFTYWSNAKGDTLSKTPHLDLVIQSDTTIIANFVNKIGIAEHNQDNIYIYPNPATNILHISFTDILERNIEISITNLLGDKMFSLNTNDMKQDNNIFKIDISDFPSGIYIVYFNFTNKTIIKKVIVGG